MGTLLKQIYPTARKEHLCYFCGGVINKGEKYSRQSVENDGSVDDITTHINCNKLAEQLKMYEGIYIKRHKTHKSLACGM